MTTEPSFLAAASKAGSSQEGDGVRGCVSVKPGATPSANAIAASAPVRVAAQSSLTASLPVFVIPAA